MDGEYEALVNYTDREIQKHSDRQTDTSPFPTCSATSLTLLTYGLRGESKGLPPEPWHGQGTKGLQKKCHTAYLSTTSQRSMGGV
jgi:hypothetical protein